jgi:hypothetical protein
MVFALLSCRILASQEEIQKPRNQEVIHSFLASEFFSGLRFGCGFAAPSL